MQLPLPKLFQVCMPAFFPEKIDGKRKVPHWMYSFQGLMLSASFWHDEILYEKPTTLMVDSSGFQYGGKHKRDMYHEFYKNRERYYRFQSYWADWAIAGDIPIRLTKDKDFIRQCLEMTMDNMDMQCDLGLEDRLLNVLHGHDPDTMRYWYRGVHGYPCAGWALGSAIKTSTHAFALQIFALREFGAFDEPVKIVHCLGAVSTDLVVGMYYLFEQMGVEVENLTFDASSSSSHRFGRMVDENGKHVEFDEIRKGRGKVRIPFEIDGTVRVPDSAAIDNGYLVRVPDSIKILDGTYDFISRINMVNTQLSWEKRVYDAIHDHGLLYQQVVERSGAAWMWRMYKSLGLDGVYKELVRQGIFRNIKKIEHRDEFRLV